MNQSFKVFLIACFVARTVVSVAQGNEPEQRLQLDSSVRVGLLKNGFTYYLKFVPNSQIHCNFVVKVGFNDENVGEKGMAHLVEHMPFRRTKNFSEGKKYFKARLNPETDYLGGSTGNDLTTYSARFSSGRPEIMRDVLKFYHDVANGVIFDSTGVNLERRVVEEEMAQVPTGESYLIDSLIQSRLLPDQYRDVDLTPTNFSVAKLRMFYEKWYRSDLQALIVVGEIDIDEVERSIQNDFSDLIPSVGKIENDRADISDLANSESSFNLIVDSALVSTRLEIIFKRKYVRSHTAKDAKEITAMKLFNIMAAQRVFNSAEEPSSYATSALAPVYLNKFLLRGPKFGLIRFSSFTLDADGSELLNDVLIEIERLRRYGFTNDELSAAKKILLSNIRSAAKRQTMNIVLNLANHFTDGSVESDGLTVKLCEELDAEYLNSLIKSWLYPDNGMKVFFLVPGDSRKLIVDSDIRALTSEISKMTLDSFRIVASGPIRTLPTQLIQNVNNPTIARRVKVRKKHNRSTGVLRLLFDNDVEVLIKSIRGGKQQGSSALLQSVECIKCISPHELSEDTALGDIAAKIVSKSGLGEFSQKELEIFLQQRGVSVMTPYSYLNHNGFSAEFKPRELETVLQAVYLYITEPKVDSSEILSCVRKMTSIDRRNGESTRTKFLDSVSRALTPDQVLDYGRRIDFGNLSRDKLVRSFRATYGNTCGSKFVVVGDFDLDSVTFLAYKYLACLPKPSCRRKRVSAEGKLRVRPLHDIVMYTRDRKVSRADVILILEDSLSVAAEKRIALQIFSDYLNLCLEEELRKKTGMVYSAVGGLRPVSNKWRVRWVLQTSCLPENVDSLILRVQSEIERISNKEIDQSLFAALKIKSKETFERQIHRPAFWRDYLIELVSGNDHRKESVLSVHNLFDKISTSEMADVADGFIRNAIVKFVLKPL